MEKRLHPLKAWRLKQEPKWTLADLAGAVSVSASHLSEIENYNNDPSLALLGDLHRVTGLNIADFEKPKEAAA